MIPCILYAIHLTKMVVALHNNMGIIVNILFMAPRMVYCSITNLLWSLKSKMSTMIVDGRQMVSMTLSSKLS